MIARLGAGLARLLGIDTADVVTHDERRQQVRTVVAIALPVGLAFTFYNFVQGFTMLAGVEGAACVLLILAGYLQSRDNTLLALAEWLAVAWAGLVTAARVEQSSGHRLLDDAALSAVRSLRSLPADAPQEALLPVRFRLR